MNINASIIDQRLIAVQEIIRQRATDELRITEEGKLRTLAFVYLCVKSILDLEDQESFDCLTEDSGDFGVDAILIQKLLDIDISSS